MIRSSIARRRGLFSKASEQGKSMTSSHNFRLVSSAICLLLIAGCRQDMHNQPKYRPLRESGFFRDTSSARPMIEGTIARGTLQEDEALFTGKLAGATVKELPFAIDAKDLDRGQER